MNISFLMLFLPACFSLNLAPGPNNLLSITNAAHHGFYFSIFAGIGRLFAFIIMISLSAAGLAAVIYTSEIIFLIIKTVGILYLLYLAIKFWTDKNHEIVNKTDITSGTLGLAMRREFLIAIGNPKAILIFTAFLPQFITPEKGMIGIQFLQLGIYFIILEWFAIALYAYLGIHLKKLLNSQKSKRIFNKICGSLLGFAGLALLFARRSTGN